MLRRSLLWRLYAGYVGLVIALTLLVSLLIIPDLRRAYEEDTRSSLRAQATLLQDIARDAMVEVRAAGVLDRPAAFSHPSSVTLRQRVSDLRDRTETRLTVVTPTGLVIADSHEDAAAMENHASRPELRAALAGREGISVRYSRTLRTEMMYFALDVSDASGQLGLVRTSLSLAAIDARIGALRNGVLTAAAVSLLIALVVGWLLAQRVTRPLRLVTSAVRSMREGDYGRQIRVDSTDEVGALAGAFNEMGVELQGRLDRIRAEGNKTLAILAAMKEGVIAVDRKERIVHLNRAAGDLLRVDAESSIGRPLWEVVRVTDVCSIISETIRSGEARTLETRIEGEDRDRVVELESSILVDAESRQTGAVLVLHDISEVRRLEGVRKDFVSNVSHELKTPLTAISGLVESILDDPGMDGETRQRFLGKVQSQSRRLGDLVQDLLSLARLERQEQMGDTVELDLRESLRESVDVLSAVVAEKPLTLELDVAADPLLVRADEESLRLIFDNLLSNAVRYTPSGGSVRVGARRDDDRIVVEVSDTGIGIEPRHQRRIFERFYRVDSARSRELGGTGLGLSIVKHVVNGLAGEVGVESTPGEGSSFRVVLPAADAESTD